MAKKKTEEPAKERTPFPPCVEMVALRKPPERTMFLRHQGGEGTYGPHKFKFDVNINFDCFIVEFNGDYKNGRFILSIHDVVPKAFDAWVRERAAEGDPIVGEQLVPQSVSPAPAPPGPQQIDKKVALGYRLMARKMAGMILLDRLKDGCLNAVRAGGDIECGVCRLPYHEHPQVTDMPTFHILCDRKIVKL